jgi:hypothetical protein
MSLRSSGTFHDCSFALLPRRPLLVDPPALVNLLCRRAAAGASRARRGASDLVAAPVERLGRRICLGRRVPLACPGRLPPAGELHRSLSGDACRLTRARPSPHHPMLLHPRRRVSAAARAALAAAHDAAPRRLPRPRTQRLKRHRTQRLKRPRLDPSRWHRSAWPRASPPARALGAGLPRPRDAPAGRAPTAAQPRHREGGGGAARVACHPPPSLPY